MYMQGYTQEMRRINDDLKYQLDMWRLILRENTILKEYEEPRM